MSHNREGCKWRAAIQINIRPVMRNKKTPLYRTFSYWEAGMFSATNHRLRCSCILRSTAGLYVSVFVTYLCRMGTIRVQVRRRIRYKSCQPGQNTVHKNFSTSTVVYSVSSPLDKTEMKVLSNRVFCVRLSLLGDHSAPGAEDRHQSRERPSGTHQNCKNIEIQTPLKTHASRSARRVPTKADQSHNAMRVFAATKWRTCKCVQKWE